MAKKPNVTTKTQKLFVAIAMDGDYCFGCVAPQKKDAYNEARYDGQVIAFYEIPIKIHKNAGSNIPTIKLETLDAIWN